MNAHWQRYTQHLCVVDSLGLSLDVSKMRFTDAWLASMQAPLTKAFDDMVKLEQGAIANSRAAAAHIGRSDGGLVEDHGCHTGGNRLVMGVADADAGNVGQKVLHVSFLSGHIPITTRGTVTLALA